MGSSSGKWFLKNQVLGWSGGWFLRSIMQKLGLCFVKLWKHVCGQTVESEKVRRKEENKG